MRHLLLILLLASALAACAPTVASPQPQSTPVSPLQVTATSTDDPALVATLFPNQNGSGWPTGLTRIDEQGMIVVEVTPTNLETPAETLIFDVVMNTHSVNLDMDLAALATLTTDTGLSIPALQWDAPSGGGHHLSGQLIFPSTQDGRSVLEGANKLTLTIIDLDTPARVFEWDLQ